MSYLLSNKSDRALAAPLEQILMKGSPLTLHLDDTDRKRLERIPYIHLSSERAATRGRVETRLNPHVLATPEKFCESFLCYAETHFTSEKLSAAVTAADWLRHQRKIQENAQKKYRKISTEKQQISGECGELLLILMLREMLDDLRASEADIQLLEEETGDTMDLNEKTGLRFVSEHNCIIRDEERNLEEFDAAVLVGARPDSLFLFDVCTSCSTVAKKCRRDGWKLEKARLLAGNDVHLEKIHVTFGLLESKFFIFDDMRVIFLQGGIAHIQSLCAATENTAQGGSFEDFKNILRTFHTTS